MAQRCTFGAVVCCAPAPIRLPPIAPAVARLKKPAPATKQRPNDPSPEAIRTLTAEIRRGWSREEERKRRRWSIACPVEFNEAYRPLATT